MEKDIYIPNAGRINLIKVDDYALEHLPKHMEEGGVDMGIVVEIKEEIAHIKRTSPSRKYIKN